SSESFLRTIGSETTLMSHLISTGLNMHQVPSPQQLSPQSACNNINTHYTSYWAITRYASAAGGNVIRLTYRIETPGPVEAMAMKIASDQSTGTFVALPGETEALKARVAARVVAIRPLPPVDRASFPDEAGDATQFSRADVDIDFPLDAIGTDFSALMTIAIGGVFSIKGMTGIRIVDMKLPLGFA